MPAKVEITQHSAACWELKVNLIPRHNDPRKHEFEAFLAHNNLRVNKDYGWSARGYQILTILVESHSQAEEAKKLIEEWGEENLPK
ncbi:MAG: hypothetical protein A2359_03640 [Candidatus Moranbacteria bacterium RIFOXYB1_FULL_43_19]|nr:MAG: hypothetical protein A2184_02185 [Candidatus Moranbacteria bacterium RIFOXYA1_FULL_44_7]OGI26738.1 MAG: hypothetical protein A2359_03640 [Candidatus Moranbacteria bacterium RIFOXYB1_FULL_43_19]OGI32499.1 MAG: hypothetical protein A2420_02885 [Candidatus Moranbacteria bacterium RIFOXYC1_FULL_44_13]OGI37622.1 MAG: hypothetical protein A2612_04325 [Candidatus Moranbacteria bacterium RIFOXYD1_FULL_44_12]